MGSLVDYVITAHKMGLDVWGIALKLSGNNGYYPAHCFMMRLYADDYFKSYADNHFDFPLLVKMQSLRGNPRFLAAVKVDLGQGLNIKEISTLLGVTYKHVEKARDCILAGAVGARIDKVVGAAHEEAEVYERRISIKAKRKARHDKERRAEEESKIEAKLKAKSKAEAEYELKSKNQYRNKCAAEYRAAQQEKWALWCDATDDDNTHDLQVYIDKSMRN